MACTRSAKRWALTPTPGVLRGQGMTMVQWVVAWATAGAATPAVATAAVESRWRRRIPLILHEASFAACLSARRRFGETVDQVQERAEHAPLDATLWTEIPAV